MQVVNLGHQIYLLLQLENGQLVGLGCQAFQNL